MNGTGEIVGSFSSSLLAYAGRKVALNMAAPGAI